LDLTHQARERGDRIVVLTHVPFDSDAASKATVCYDCDEVIKILHEDGAGRVVAVFAGHCHKGGYNVDREGLHHITMPSPLSYAECFAHVEVHEDRLELVGGGGVTSRTLPFPKCQKLVPTARPASAYE
jgi:manganese-dependent ADP-ribose/CDP-alcohol diphosphatase